jgi:hypothetical protein
MYVLFSVLLFLVFYSLVIERLQVLKKKFQDWCKTFKPNIFSPGTTTDLNEPNVVNHNHSISPRSLMDMYEKERYEQKEEKVEEQHEKSEKALGLRQLSYEKSSDLDNNSHQQPNDDYLHNIDQDVDFQQVLDNKLQQLNK